MPITLKNSATFAAAAVLAVSSLAQTNDSTAEWNSKTRYHNPFKVYPLSAEVSGRTASNGGSTLVQDYSCVSSNAAASRACEQDKKIRQFLEVECVETPTQPRGYCLTLKR